MSSEIGTLNEINALPIGAILRGKNGGVWEVDDEETDGTEVRYRGAGVKDYHTGAILLSLYGPITCVWTPNASEAKRD